MKHNDTESRFLPYQPTFQTMKKWRSVGLYLLYSISVLSILIPAVSQLPPEQGVYLAKSILEFANYLLIVSYYVVNVVTEVFLYPAAARQRRLNFIDNSLGSRFLGRVNPLF